MSGKQKILITGANGYLGSHITELLCKSGHDVRALCFEYFDELKKWTEQGVKIIRGDITQQSCFETLESYAFDTIIHLVSLNHFDSEKDPGRVLKVNVLPTWNLLKKFADKGLKKFIYFSTQQVYGRIPCVEISEAYPPKPVNSYGLTHLQSEQIVNLYNTISGVDGINIRLSNSFGAPVFKQNNCWWLVVNDLCRTAYRERKIKLLSDGSPQRDFIHVSDVAAAVKVLVENTSLNTKLFNISSGNTYTILELAKTVRKIYHQRYHSEIPILDTNDVEFDLSKKITNPKYTIINSAITDAGLVLKTDLEMGINELFQYLEKN
ncbi:MAG: NAD-dependent epimerase/dehydratase family protein [Draconibacterium sp.]